MRKFFLFCTLLASLILLIFLLYTPSAFASTRATVGNASVEPKGLQIHGRDSRLSPNDGACASNINASKKETIMYATVSITCTGVVYWIHVTTRSEHCKQSALGTCWGGWDSTNYVPTCDFHYISSLKCPTSGSYQREAVSGQLWRWADTVCVQETAADTAPCGDDSAQIQF